MLASFRIPLSWGELVKRTAAAVSEDDCLGMAAQLAYYFFFALFPAILFVLGVASFFPLTSLIDAISGALRTAAPAEVADFVEQELMHLSDANSGGVLTFGILAALWSSSAGVVAIIGSLNRAYDIDEARPWWQVRLTALALTLALATLGLLAFGLIVAGSTAAAGIAMSLGFGGAFKQAWNILQWPVAFFLVSTAIGLIYRYAPDAEQDWTWVTPGAALATLLWFIASLVFKFYVSSVTDYNATYGAAGGVMVLLLWFYMSGLAVLVGAEMNAEIEHASPWGKAVGEKVPGQRRKIGAAAARAFRKLRPVQAPAAAQIQQPTRRSEMAHERDERSLGELVADLSRDTRALIQEELRLAKTELSEEAAAMGRGASFVAGGGLVAYGGLLAIVAAMVLGLTAAGLPPWAAALIGGAVAAALGYGLVLSGLAAIKAHRLAPRKTIDTLKEDAQWLKEQTR